MDEKTIEKYAGLWAHIEPPSSRRLLLAALEAFALHGFHGATTRDIASRAGMSPAAVYFHYASKAELLYEISRTGHDEVWSQVNRAIDGLTDPSDRMRAFAEAFATFHAEFHTLARVVQYELDVLVDEAQDEIRNQRRRFEKLVRDEIRRGVEANVFDVTDIRGTAIAILSLGIDVARWYAPNAPRAFTPVQIGRLYGELTLRMIGASSTA